MTIVAPAQLSDVELLSETTRAAVHERSATARLIALLAELDDRRLYLGEGCSSLFTYCTQVLRLSEHAAYGRIEAARAARRHPVVLEMLGEGALTLTTVCLLAPHLTAANAHDLLRATRHKSKRETEQILAALRPLPPVESSVRKLPAARAARPPLASTTERPAQNTSCDDGRTQDLATRPPAPPRPAIVAPLAPER